MPLAQGERHLLRGRRPGPRGCGSRRPRWCSSAAPGRAQKVNVSVMSRIGPRRRIDVGAARDVLLEDVVLDGAGQRHEQGIPRSWATRRCRGRSRVAAVALMVIEVNTSPSGMPFIRTLHVLNRVDRHPDPAHFAGRQRVSESRPIWVGRSKATDNPTAPLRPANTGTAEFDSAAVPNPAYWRIVHSRARYCVSWIAPGVGDSPGSPESRRPGRSRPARPGP